MVKYAWVNMPLEDLYEFINVGDQFQFQFNEKDYHIEGNYFDNEAKGRVGAYLIQDPDIQENGDWGDNPKYYPENEQFKNATELLNAPFLEGKTIIERYVELKFFD
jgi:hypothetical protein